MAKGRPNRQKPLHRSPSAANPGVSRPGSPGQAGRGSSPSRHHSPAAHVGGAHTPVPRTPPGRELVYGRNSVRETLRGMRRTFQVFVEEGPRAGLAVGEVETWIEAARRQHGDTRAAPPKITLLAADELGARLGTTDHQGVGAEVEEYLYAET